MERRGGGTRGKEGERGNRGEKRRKEGERGERGEKRGKEWERGERGEKRGKEWEERGRRGKERGGKGRKGKEREERKEERRGGVRETIGTRERQLNPCQKTPSTGSSTLGDMLSHPYAVYAI